MRLLSHSTKTLAHPWEQQTQNHARALTWAPAPLKDIARENHDIIKQLAKTFIKVAESRGLFGCLRDNEALSYWTGAATALKFAGFGALSEDVARVGAIEIAPRGYQAIMEISLL